MVIGNGWKKVSITGVSQFAQATIGDVTIAPNGDIFATGRFYDSISFGSISLTSTGYYDSWVAKLSPDVSGCGLKLYVEMVIMMVL